MPRSRLPRTSGARSPTVAVLSSGAATPDDCVDQSCPELGSNFAYWVNDIGHVMIKQAKLNIGGQTVDRMLGTFLIAWEELTGKSGRD